MNRFLQILNFLGIVSLAVLCSLQWRTNRALNVDAIDREKTLLRQTSTIEDQEKTIKGDAADLEDFRQRLVLSEAALKESQRKFRDLAAERDKLVIERDQLKANLDKWAAAVAERDATLKQANERLQSLSQERNDAISKFNDLAVKYNAMIKALEKNGQKP